MINDLVERSDFFVGEETPGEVKDITGAANPIIARWISAAENCGKAHRDSINEITERASMIKTPILGITGTEERGRVQW